MKWLVLIVASMTFSETWAVDTVLITGANKGIGLELAGQYAAKDWHVIATHRRDNVPESLANLSAAHPLVQIEKVDITSVAQIRALAAKLAGTPIDVLINNAGYGGDFFGPSQTFGSLDYSKFDLIMHTNGLGALAVSEAFRSHVAASRQKKIIALSSTLASFVGGAPGGGAYWYRMSKTALHMTMYTLAKDLRDQGVIVTVMTPGLVLSQKNLNRGIPASAMVDGALSVAGLIEQIDRLTPEDSGGFISYAGKRMSF